MKTIISLLAIISFMSSHAYASEQDKAIAIAITKLSQSLKIDKKDISLESSQAVTWRNSALGCPQPDMQYMDAITPGFRIKLKAKDHHYWVHTGNKRYIICKNPLKASKETPIADPDA